MTTTSSVFAAAAGVTESVIREVQDTCSVFTNADQEGEIILSTIGWGHAEIDKLAELTGIPRADLEDNYIIFYAG